MKTWPQFVLSVTFAVITFATFNSGAETLSFYLASHGKTVDVDLDLLSNGDPEEAWRIYGMVWRGRHSLKIEEIAQKAGRAIAENPGVQAMAETKFKPATSGYQSEMEELLILGGIPAPWSARLLGAHLMNTTPMDPTIMNQGDVGYFDNQWGTVEALTNMGFSDAPTKPDKNGFVQAPVDNSSALEKWQAWWKANEGRIEQRIREINPGYYPPQPVVTATATPSPIPKPAVAGEYASTPAVSNTPKPTPSATPVATAPAKQSDWAIYAIGGLVALGALAAAGWAMRKR